MKYTNLLMLTTIFVLACSLGGQAGTVIPADRPASFDVQTSTPTLDLPRVTAKPQPAETEPAVVLSLGDAPTHTPGPNNEPTKTPVRISTPTLEATEETATEEAIGGIFPTDELTPTIVVAPPTPQPVSEPDPPLQGGDWDFETEFIPWANPYGEPCPGSAVSGGWTAFVEEGQFGSSCMIENQYGPNVLSGVKSQEITFDFIAANSGVWRTIPTQPGHRYTIVAHAKSAPSTVPVEMYLGVDLTGDTVWNAETVQWLPWRSNTQDVWGATEETVTATGESLTIFLRGYHPLAEQGGKTVIDNVSVTDLGL